MAEWFSLENLEQAWKYVRLDIRDDFVFDVLDYEDIKLNQDKVLRSLYNQIKSGQYTPASIVRIGVPKNDHSVRPGTVIPVIDLIVLYAIAQQLAPVLDTLLSDSSYAYRLNPKSKKSREPLFKAKGETLVDKKEDGQELADEDENEVDELLDIDFPSGWFANWKAFHDLGKIASQEYKFAAITDITGYFENIYLDLLREILKGKLNSDEHIDLINRLFHYLEYWDWTRPGNLPKGRGLPQGNDVSAFLSNLYLLSLDEAMLEIVAGDNSKYSRYVDDIKLFSSNKDEARRALIKLESTLRTLNLNVQSAKTKIIPASEVVDNEVEVWLDRMSDENPSKLAYAVEFFENIFDVDNLDKWLRPYTRCLTHFGRNDDDRAASRALDIFLENPSYRLLQKQFIYLRIFAPSNNLSEQIVDRLNQQIFTFPYHKGFMFRLAAYSRDNNDELKQISISEAIDTEAHWFSRMSALFCLITFPLDGKDLEKIKTIIDNDANYLVVRAAYVALCQYWGDSLRGILDRISLFNAPHQDYLRRYFFQLYRDSFIGKQVLSKIENEKIEKPFFVHKLHQLDLLKSSSNSDQRALFHKVVESKIEDTNDNDWPRLTSRLKRIHDIFIESA